MDRPFDDEDKQKRVVTADGQDIGHVRDVHGDRATVERDDDSESLTDEVKELLGWSDDDEADELHQDHVDRYDDEKVHLNPRR